MRFDAYQANKFRGKYENGAKTKRKGNKEFFYSSKGKIPLLNDLNKS